MPGVSVQSDLLQMCNEMEDMKQLWPMTAQRINLVLWLRDASIHSDKMQICTENKDAMPCVFSSNGNASYTPSTC